MRLCSMRAPSSTWTSWKCTVRSSVAEWTFTGTSTPPKAIVPFQIERSAMSGGYPGARVELTRRGRPADKDRARRCRAHEDESSGDQPAQHRERDADQPVPG